MATVTDQLGHPDKNDFIDARYTLNRLWLHDGSVAAPATPINVYHVQEFSADAPAFDIEEEVFQQGGGDESVIEQRGYKYSLRFSIQEGEWGTLMAQILGITWSTVGEAALISRFSQYPIFTLERICRRKDNETHVFTDVYQDLIIKPTSISGSMGSNNLREIEAFSKHDMFRLCSGAELEYSQWTGDGSTVDFTIPSTPLTLTDITAQAREDWELDTAVFVKVKGASDHTGTRQATGVSIATTTLSFTTAPANGTVVQALYAKATS